MAHLDQYIEYQVRQMIFKIAIPILVLCGTVGNSISLLVLLKPEQRRSPTARIITVLAFSDLFTLWGGGLNNWILVMFDINIKESSNFVCKLYSFMNILFAYMSAFCIGAVTLNRFIAVLLPLKVKSISTLRNTHILLFCLVIVSTLANCHVLYGYGLKEQGHCAQVEEKYNTFIIKMWINGQLFLFYVNIACVFIANICIIGKLVHRRRLLRKQFINARRSTLEKTSKTTRTLVLVNVVFLLCYVPSGAFGVKYRGRPQEHGTDNGTGHDDAAMLLFWAVSLIAYMFNSTINFVLYFFSASKFRKEVKKLFK